MISKKVSSLYKLKLTSPFDEFIPIKLRVAIKSTDPLLAIQVTTFECGGVAIGVVANHKLVDACTLSVFLNEWAAINKQDKDINFVPRFEASLMFPTRSLPREPLPWPDYTPLNKSIRKRISFSQSEILNMKAKDKRWSKVQIVAAIIWKTFIGVELAKHGNIRKESIMFTHINLREKMASLIPKHTCGNLIGTIEIRSSMLETTEKMVDIVSDSVKKTVSEYSKVHHDSEEGQLMVYDSWLKMGKVGDSGHLVLVSSWCKYPFYEADFGLGKPVWVSPATIPYNNLALLLDDAGGGVEVFVFLRVEDVEHFEKALAEHRFFIRKMKG